MGGYTPPKVHLCPDSNNGRGKYYGAFSSVEVVGLCVVAGGSGARGALRGVSESVSKGGVW